MTTKHSLTYSLGHQGVGMNIGLPLLAVLYITIYSLLHLKCQKELLGSFLLKFSQLEGGLRFSCL